MRTGRSTSEATALSINRFGPQGAGNDDSQIYPVMIRDGLYESFFKSIALDLEPGPESFCLICFPTFKNVLNAPENLAIADSFSQGPDFLLAKFLELVRKDVGKAAELFSKADGMAQPVRVAFFSHALAYSPSLAEMIIQGDNAISLVDFDVARWFWDLLIDEDLGKSGPQLAAAFEVLSALGADLNRPTKVVDLAGRVAFNGTIAHLLADELGLAFNVGFNGLAETNAATLLNELLNLGIDINTRAGDGTGPTAREIAFAHDRAITLNMFRKTIENRELHTQLTGLLTSSSVSRS